MMNRLRLGRLVSGLSRASVTGSRLEVDALDLPQSISAIDQQNMRVKAQSTVTDAANGTTGLTGYARAGAAGVYLWRGFSGESPRAPAP